MLFKRKEVENITELENTSYGEVFAFKDNPNIYMRINPKKLKIEFDTLEANKCKEDYIPCIRLSIGELEMFYRKCFVIKIKGEFIEK